MGNWPGKTVERAEGTLHFEGCTVKVLDLPGIYSLSTFSMEKPEILRTSLGLRPMMGSTSNGSSSQISLLNPTLLKPLYRGDLDVIKQLVLSGA
jgi:hypothetical protein